MKRLKSFSIGALVAVLLALPIILAQAPRMTPQRSFGVLAERGMFIELTAGAAVVAGNALYLDSAGKVQKYTSAQAANFIGVAYNTAASAATVQVQISGVATVTCDGNVTINDKEGGTGLAVAGAVKTLASTLAASGAVLTSGAGTVTSGATTGTVTSGAGTIAVTVNGSGGTTVLMGTTNPTGTSALTSTATTGTLTSTATTLTSTAITQPTIAGDNPASRVAGRALSACTDTGTFTVLLLPQ